MIVVDTSALVAIFAQEPDAFVYVKCISEDEQPWVSAASLLEASLVMRGLRRLSPQTTEHWLDEFLQIAAFQVAPVTEAHSRIARRAHSMFGKGSGHPARLNFGDCFVYALAVALDVPLLFKGEYFARTDLRRAL